MESDEGEGCLPIYYDEEEEKIAVGNVKTGEQVNVCNEYGWSTHNCSCLGSKTGLVLYPTDLQYKNIVLLVCEKCYKYDASKGTTQHDQLEKWYYDIYGTTKSFRFTTGFSLKADGKLGFNSSSKNSIGSSYHTTDRTMEKFERDAITKVVNGKLSSYDASSGARPVEADAKNGGIFDELSPTADSPDLKNKSFENNSSYERSDYSLSWPTFGEIDTLEMIGGYKHVNLTDQYAHAAVHWNNQSNTMASVYNKYTSQVWPTPDGSMLHNNSSEIIDPSL